MNNNNTFTKDYKVVINDNANVKSYNTILDSNIGKTKIERMKKCHKGRF